MHSRGVSSEYLRVLLLRVATDCIDHTFLYYVSIGLIPVVTTLVGISSYCAFDLSRKWVAGCLYI